MTENDFLTFGHVWSQTCNVLGAPAPDSETLEIIFDDLRDYPLEQVLAALKNHRKTSQFIPKPADIVNFIKNAESTAAESWSLVEWSIMNFGPRAVCFEDTRIAITINKMGGYFFLINHLTDQNDDFYRKEFIDIFDSVQPQYYHPEMKICLKGPDPWLGFVNANREPYAYLKTAHVMAELNGGADRITPPNNTGFRALPYHDQKKHFQNIDPAIVAAKRHELEQIRKKIGDDWVLAALGMMKVKS